MFEKIVYEDRQITSITVTWNAGFSELMSVLKTFFDDNNTRHLLLDLRGTSLDTISHDHIRDLCQYAKCRANGHGRVNGKTALVGLSDIQYEIARIFKTYSEMVNSAIKISVFRTIEKAMSWLEEDG